MTAPDGRQPASAPAAGRSIRRAAWCGTALFTVTAAAAVLVDPLEPVALIVDVLLFVAGFVLFVAAYAKAVSRSRTESIAVTTLYFLAGSAPPDVRRSLLGALSAQVVVALATAIARPYTILAAGTLVPLYGLGLCGLWAARHGTFPPREESRRGRPR
ncbi:MAG TPA: hypothetical protein VHH09_06030 [Acidimicrobiales bacterium]|nr:hypothetical protein [Acidimicrobiales bacterium]